MPALVLDLTIIFISDAFFFAYEYFGRASASDPSVRLSLTVREKSHRPIRVRVFGIGQHISVPHGQRLIVELDVCLV